MKKANHSRARTLTLDRETVRHLDARTLTSVAGGATANSTDTDPPPTQSCFCPWSF